MSRFTKIIGTNVYAWGFDRPLQDYFFQKDDLSKAHDEQEEPVFAIASHTTLVPHPQYPGKMHFTNGDILTIMEQEEQSIGTEIVPEKHKTAIAMDQPF